MGQEIDPAAGALYLSSTVVAGGACQGAPISTNYAMGDAKPAAGKAYSGTSGGGASCGFSFKYTAAQASVLTGDVVVFAQVGCDVAGHAIEMDYNFQVGSTSVSGLVRPSVSWTCQGASSLFTYTQTFDGKDTKIKAGDVLTLTFNIFAAATVAGTPAQNWHVKTGHATTPSSVRGVGLPGGLAAAAPGAIPELFNLTGPADVPSTTPNATLEIPITITNAGTTEANFTLNATDVPSGFQVAFAPANGSAAPGGAANVTVSVAVPAEGAAGNYSFTVMAIGANGGNATLAVPFVVTLAAPPSGNATTNETGAALSEAADDEGGLPGPSLVFVVAATGAVAVWIRRRRA